MLIYSKYYKDFSYKISKIQLKTENHTDGDFAFIHDASEVRYQYYHNCNFTEVGEPFAEQPLAVAVQQVRYAINQISFVWLSLIEFLKCKAVYHNISFYYREAIYKKR